MPEKPKFALRLGWCGFAPHWESHSLPGRIVPSFHNRELINTSCKQKFDFLWIARRFQSRFATSEEKFHVKLWFSAVSKQIRDREFNFASLGTQQLSLLLIYNRLFCSVISQIIALSCTIFETHLLQLSVYLELHISLYVAVLSWTWTSSNPFFSLCYLHLVFFGIVTFPFFFF